MPLHGTFDAFIASHVIEHTPDLIDFLQTSEILLKSSGVVVLAIPDKRYCFDYFQPLTTPGQVLAAHAEGRSRHTRRTAFDHVASELLIPSMKYGQEKEMRRDGFTLFEYGKKGAIFG